LRDEEYGAGARSVAGMLREKECRSIRGAHRDEPGESGLMLMSPIFDETKTYVPAGRRYCVSNSQYWDCFMWCFHGQPKPRSRSLLTSTT
jgi:hypothetical protein